MQPAPREWPIAIENGRVQITASFAVPASALPVFKKGGAVAFVVRAYLVDQASGAIVGANAVACRVQYDLWQEVFAIQSFDGASYAVNLKGVRRKCLEPQGLVLADAVQLKPHAAYRVVAIAETNPSNPSAGMLMMAHGTNAPLAPLLGTTSQVSGGVPCGGVDHRFVAP